MKDPLVSVVIPAYNRPYFLEVALSSVLRQTYSNIEIVICDDSTDDQVQSMLIPYLERFSCIRYYKNEKNLFVQNFHKCFQLAKGELINYLMDDDLFHPEKVQKMVDVLQRFEDVSLVTSYRQPFDQHGNLLPPIKATVKLFEQTAVLNGKTFGNYVLSHCINVIGEPTTVMFRKADLTENFGMYRGKQYSTLNDVASWLLLLSKGKAVYLPEAYSYFRMHPEQNRSFDVLYAPLTEWLDLMVDSRKDGFLETDHLFKAALYTHRQYVEELQKVQDPRVREKVDTVEKRIDSILRTLK
ncbi:glycosyltransferase family 2 protein [Salinithrix halophila]|uniref:Glycosyltransferase family 2 protein n=1 Tax=Salinithrix halophila TaxID=1485204 RepID=A0ABV8JJF2_9BACL